MILWLVWVFPDCSGAATEDGVIVSFAGRDKTSSSELGVELGIKVNLHTHLASAKKMCRVTGMGVHVGP